MMKIYLLVLAGTIFLISSIACNKKETATYYYKGYLIDSITLEPIKDANVTAIYYNDVNVGNNTYNDKRIAGRCITADDGSFNLEATLPKEKGEPGITHDAYTAYGYHDTAISSYGKSKDYMDRWNSGNPIKILVNPEGFVKIKVKNKSGITNIEHVLVKYVWNRKDTITFDFVDNTFGINGEISMNSDGVEAKMRANIDIPIYYTIQRTGLPAEYKTTKMVGKRKYYKDGTLIAGELSIDL